MNKSSHFSVFGRHIENCFESFRWPGTLCPRPLCGIRLACKSGVGPKDPGHFRAFYGVGPKDPDHFCSFIGWDFGAHPKHLQIFILSQWQKKGFSHQLHSESESVGEGIALGDTVHFVHTFLEFLQRFLLLFC